MDPKIAASFSHQGFAKVERILQDAEISTLTEQFPSVRGGLRNLVTTQAEG
jgi:hypothetical protein